MGRSPMGHTYGPTLMHVWVTLIGLIGLKYGHEFGKGSFWEWVQGEMVVGKDIKKYISKILKENIKIFLK